MKDNDMIKQKTSKKVKINNDENSIRTWVVKTMKSDIQWVLQIREFSLIWLEISKIANKGILNIPLFDPKFREKS